MSRFREELRVIPRIVWLIVIVAYVGLAMGLLIAFTSKPEPGAPPWEYLFSFTLPLIFALYVLLAGYVYGDAKRRNMRAVMWTLLALLIPNAIGFILYFIMREPLMLACPNCGTPVRENFAFCPHCGKSRARSCPQCRQAVEPDWPHCAHCGASLSANIKVESQ
jgi:hypothetical protein